MTEQIEAPVSTARHALRPAVPVEPPYVDQAVGRTVDRPIDRPGNHAGDRPGDQPGDHAAVRADRERVRRARAAYEARLSRLRLYSYCLTLGACVLALMSFMYVTQGAADGDPTFTWLGVAFAAATAVALWSAIAITKLGEVAAT